MTVRPQAESGDPLRADARRNRDQIIAAARVMFAEHGPEVPMDEIARAAKVGVGTLYRRFPDRDALIREIARENFESVLTEAQAAIAEEPTAWQALVRFLRHSTELRLSVQLAMLSPKLATVIRDDPKMDEYRRALVGELDKVVRAAQRENMLRQDVGTGDVVMMFTLLIRHLPGHYDDPDLQASDRCLTLMLDGLRNRSGSVLPGRPLNGEDLVVSAAEFRR